MRSPQAQPLSPQQVLALLSSYDGGNPGSGTGEAGQSLGAAAFTREFCSRTGLPLCLDRTSDSDSLAGYFNNIHGWVAGHAQALQSYVPPVLHLGGDHSIAMGFWSGFLDAFPTQTLGLLWLDAHLDAHTSASSPSGHIHGMPVAGLLGLPDTRLQSWYPGARCLRPTQLVLMGVRHYEAAEQQHLAQSGVRWHSHLGTETQAAITQALLGAYHDLAARCDWVGISLDLDVFEPSEAPGVATPAPHGWPVAAVQDAVRQIRGHPQWLGWEIAEYCPPNDQQGRTCQIVMELLATVYSNR